MISKVANRRAFLRLGRGEIGWATSLVTTIVLFPSLLALADTYIVSSSADSGPGSLRQAILDANANPGPDTIFFAIGDVGSQQTIQPTTALPAITDPATIDGWSQGGAGYTGTPLIELSGALAGNSVVGLNITGGNCVVRGLVINGFLGTFGGAIRLQSNGNNWIYGNYIGVNFAGDARIANQRGVWIDNGSSTNRIGTNADGVNDASERNVISANIDQNIWIYQPTTTGNKVMGNYIGLNAAGMAAVGTNNQTVAVNGVLVQEAGHTVIGTDGDGQGDELEGNVIGGNTYNIQLTGTSQHTRISGNRIGVNAAGTASVGLQVEGVRVYVTENNIVGTDGNGVSDALEGNLISGHSDFGILVQQTGALSNVIAGNKIGTDLAGMSAIPNGYNGSPRGGIYLGGYGNRVGSNLDGVSDELERNLISGNTFVSSSGILLQYVDQPGAVPNSIIGNWIGVDASGLAALPNNYGLSGASGAMNGLVIRNNIISGHTYDGISLTMNNASVTGNLVGVGADGVTALGNGQHGINLSGSDNIIGGTGPGQVNIIANNGTSSAFYSGVLVGITALRNTIRGNRIYANSRLGIDLRWPDGVNINDLGDPDTGANNLQNFPIITFAQAYNNGATRIQGALNSHPNTLFTVDFYYNTAPDPSGHGEGEFYLAEAQVMTDASSNAVFDVFLPVTLPPNVHVTATATHPDGSTSEFSPAYAAGGTVDVPLAGLSATYTGLGFVSNAITFSASVTNGTGVSFTWNFGDGQQAAGAQVEHIYVQPGEYNVTVQASNNISSASLQMLVAVIVPANINGMVWDDQDADGILGIGEAADPSALVTVSGPEFLHTTNVNAQGRFAIFTGEAGNYEVSVTVSNRIATTPNPVVVLMGTNGGTVVNFGLHESPTNGHGFITGRAWNDLDGSGFPEPDEEPLPGMELLFYGWQYPPQTITTDSNGLFSLHLPHERVYVLTMFAPGFFPPERRLGGFSIWLDQDTPVLNYHSPFARGGTVSGRVRDLSGAGVPNAHLSIGPPINVTTTDANGDYAFIEQTPAESKGLGINPPYPYVPYNGNGVRVFPLSANSVVIQDWLVQKRGRLTVRAEQSVGSETLPVGFVFFRLQGGWVDELMVTGLDGQASRDLEAGTYTITVQTEYLPTNAIVSPSSRIVSIANETFATATFKMAPAQSIGVVCEALGTGFPATVEVHNSTGLVESRSVTPPSATTLFTTLSSGTYEVRILPAAGLTGWPSHSQIVALNTGTHAVVHYPYNPANLQGIHGYAFHDVCVPLGIRGGGYGCNETGVPGNNGLTVTLYNGAGNVVTNTETSFGTGWDLGFYHFDELPVGEYRVVLTLPPGYIPTTSTNVVRLLDGIATPEQVHFGYQRTATPTLTGRVFIDADSNGTYDPSWDDVLSGTSIAVRTLSDTLIASLTTASDGSFTLAGIAPGDYRVVMTRPDVQRTNTVQIPALNSVTAADFPLPPPGGVPRVLVFADLNNNGLADPGEQRFGGVTVQLIAGPCDEPGTLLETVLTGSDGVAVFAVPPAGDAPLCARITAGLPPNTVPFHVPGIVVPRDSGQAVPAPVVPGLTEPPLRVADSFSVRNDFLSLIYRSTRDRSYTVQRTSALDSWSDVTNATTYDFGYSQRVIIPLYTNIYQSFFRLVEQR